MLKSQSSYFKTIISQKSFDFTIYIGFLVFIISLPFGYSIVFVNIGMTLILIGWLGRIISNRKLAWKRTPLDLPIFLFLCLALIASFFAPHRASSSLGFFWKLFRAILLFYAVIHSQLGHRWKHVVIGLIAAGCISSTLGLWYYINDSRLALDFMGRVGIEYQDELSIDKKISNKLRSELRDINIPLSSDASIVDSKHLDEWRIDDSTRDRRYVIHNNTTHLMVYMIENRLTGTFKMPNDLGAYLALSLPFMIGYFVSSWQSLRKQKHGIWLIVALSFVVVIMTTNLLLTLTRAAWVSVAIAITIITIYMLVSRLVELASVKESLKVVLIGVVLLISIYVVSVILIPQHIKSRFLTIIKHPTGFMGERPQYWRTSIELIQKYPLTGIGLGRFRHEYQLNGPAEQYNIPYHAHNIYLHIAVEHGIPSLFLFLWIVVIIWKRIWSLRSIVFLDSYFWRMGTFLGGCGFLISALIYGLADNILHQRTVLLFWFIIGILFSITMIKDVTHEEELETS